MKKTIIAFGFAVTAALIGTVQAQEAKQDFTLVNKTGYEIKEVYVSPSKSTDWEEDILGEGVLDDRGSRDVHFHRSTKTCHWDLKVVYTVDSSNAVWNDIDLCTVEKITIHYDKAADTTSATFD
ncbi:MAG: hypothetical protein ABSC22_09625 [Roseiarcus sp.]|jgi:hypothetical protein